MDGKLRVGKCDLCGCTDELTRISKQIGGAFHIKDVCPKCYEEHERTLEMVRSNYEAQFGKN